jgi:hypothetical protein
LSTPSDEGGDEEDYEIEDQGTRASKLWLRCLRNEISLKGGNLQRLVADQGALLKNYVPNTEQMLKICK